MREAFEIGARGRQQLRLLVIDHLQTVFDHAQEAISGFHRVARSRVDPAVLAQFVERNERVAIAQMRIASTGDQLLGLCEEFDLADAAAPELDIVALDRDFAVAAKGIDLPLHRVHIGNCGEVEIFSPDERRQIVEDRLARRDIASAGATLDHHRAFPVLTDAFVIGHRRMGRDRNAGRGRIGPQPQIGAEHVSVTGVLL